MTTQLDKVLFLDIDGVLNTYETKERFRGTYGIDQSLLEIFRLITPTPIVLSSTWRLYPKHRAEVMRHIEIHDCTPLLNTPRHKEISAWLDKNQPKDFVILDDDLDANIEGHFFHVPNGLTHELVHAINERLRNA